MLHNFQITYFILRSKLFVSSFNTQYGIVGVPTVMLFHNGRAAAKFNNTEYTLEMFGRFIIEYTGKYHLVLYITNVLISYLYYLNVDFNLSYYRLALYFL